MKPTAWSDARSAAGSVLLGAALATAAANTANAAAVHGRVVERGTGSGVPLVHLACPAQDRHTTSDEIGRFAFDDLRPGVAWILAGRIGYGVDSLRVEITEGDTLFVSLTLRPTPLNLDTVEVEGDAIGAESTSGGARVELSGAELQARMRGTVAATLAQEPGISEQTMGPAPARPVVRGLSGHRLLVLEDGSATGDLSATSPDHAVVLEPLQARSIKIVRGPASLLYGSSALGGVVNVERDAVPTEAVTELRGSLSLQGESVSRGAAARLQLEQGFGEYAAQVDLVGRRASDLRTPNGRLPNTELRNLNGSAGLSRVGDWGFLGVSGGLYDSDYEIPGGFEGGHANGVDIELERRNLEGRSVWTPRHGSIERIEGHAGYSRYFHRELESNDVCGVSFGLLDYTGELRSHFRERTWGAATVGAAFERRDFATGCLSFIPPTIETRGALFVYHRLERGATIYEGAVRFDRSSVQPDRADTNKAGVIRDRAFSGVSASAGLERAVSAGLRARATATRSYRAPGLEELFTEGPHLAAYSYEIGNADLDAESGLGLEFGIEYDAPAVEYRLALFRNTLDGFIHPVDTGELEYGAGADGALARYQYRGGDAVMAGGETQGRWRPGVGWELDGAVSYVRGEATDRDRPLPLMPPLSGRVGSRRLFGPWTAGGAVRGAARQTRLDEFETETAPYALLDLSFEWRRPTLSNLQSVIFRLDNLLDSPWRNHLSRLKSIQPEAGRNLSVVYRLQF